MSKCKHESVVKFPLVNDPGTMVCICRDCNANLGTIAASPRQQVPGNGRQQKPRRGEEKRPL